MVPAGASVLADGSAIYEWQVQYQSLGGSTDFARLAVAFLEALGLAQEAYDREPKTGDVCAEPVRVSSGNRLIYSEMDQEITDMRRAAVPISNRVPFG